MKAVWFAILITVSPSRLIAAECVDAEVLSISPEQVRALGGAQLAASEEKLKVKDCKVVIDRDESGNVLISFLSNKERTLMEIGRPDPHCDVTFEFDPSGRSLLRRYFSR